MLVQGEYKYSWNLSVAPLLSGHSRQVWALGNSPDFALLWNLELQTIF